MALKCSFIVEITMGQSNYFVGHKAEQHAAEYLSKLGYEIKDLNWKNRFCEIDIIAQKNKVIFFIEVKYRKNSSQGSGLDYITAQKLRQMQFAAEVWISQNKRQGEYQLGAIEITSKYFTVTNFLTDIF